MKKSSLLLAGLSALLVSACVDQTQADEKMAKGCEAAINIALSPDAIKEVKGMEAADEAALDTVFRRISLTIVEKDDFAGLDKKYSCLFAQNWGPLNTSHNAVLEQVSLQDKLLGKKDGNVEGSLEEYMKLVEAANAAMGQ